MTSPATARSVSFGTATGRSVLLVTILASGMAFLDATVVTVALPSIESDLGGGFATLQWVLDAYLLTLGSLVLVGGALADLLGIRRVFAWGVAGFLVASLLCGLAPTAEALIAARALQGVGAALMVPGSLALISSLFVAEQRGRAIGLWSGLAGITTAIGPFAGGLLLATGSGGWRFIFLLNVPAAIGVLLLLTKVPSVPGSRTDAPLTRQVDVLGAVLTTVGLALVVGPLIEWAALGATTAAGVMAVGALVLVLFWLVERRRQVTQAPPPMLPPPLWRIRSFTTANLVTFVVYGALNANLLLLTVALQIGLGWTALAAGVAGLPITIMLALFSARVGRLLPRIGSRALLTAGSLLMAVGLGWLSQLGEDATYWRNVLPPILVFACGLVLLVAPITTTALGDIPVASSGVGSGVNNAVARIAGLVAIAVVPVVAGLSTLDPSAGSSVLPGFHRATLICAGLCVAGAAVSWFGFDSSTGKTQGKASA